MKKDIYLNYSSNHGNRKKRLPSYLNDGLKIASLILLTIIIGYLRAVL